jgi:hypothetical protein
MLPVGNEQENRYFNLFCAQTSFEIMPSHDAFSTRQMVLQACYSDASLKHAVIALAALDKTAETTIDFSRLSLDNGSQFTRANEHHQFSLEEYTKAVANMRTGNTLNDVRTTLISILLIFCFEAWNGNMDMAVRQIQNGVRIIQEWKSTIRDADKTPEGMSPAPHVVEHDLIRIYGRLVIQLSFFYHTLGGDLLTLYVNQEREFLDSMPTFFTTIEESLRYHQALFKRGTLFFSSFISDPPPLHSEIAIELVSEQKFTSTKSLQWLKAFDPMYKAFASGYSICESRMVRTYKAQILVAYIVVSTFFSDQTVYDKYRDMFAEITSLIEEALALQPVVGKSNPTNYSLAGRAVSTLWITGVRCRDRSIRRKSIVLLLKYPRREGVWDSLFSAKIIEFVMELEEQHLEDDYVPEWARISSIRWESDLEKRTAALICEQRTSSSSQDAVIKTKTITW